MGSLCCAAVSQPEPSLPSDPMQMTLRRKVENYLIHEGRTLDEKNFSELDLGIFSFDPSDYETMEKLSKPSSFPVSVYKVKHKVSAEIFAQKTIEIEGKTEEDIKLIINTIKGFAMASNPHLAEFYGFYFDGTKFFILEEFLENNLDKLLENFSDQAPRLLNEESITRIYLALLECSNFLLETLEKSREFILCPKHIYYKDDFSSIKISGLASILVKNHTYSTTFAAIKASRPQEKMY